MTGPEERVIRKWVLLVPKRSSRGGDHEVARYFFRRRAEKHARNLHALLGANARVARRG